ncbi:RimJ/RimL family protein N-acetyltransferase [Kribbella orskensis]|uniref:RimJ/RimL family protein N-acetyltransferase n=1 Tax=Kribbella orskensis TaxID=2512216 RepID=A0ABY2BU81_9ACTN|nr:MULTISPECIES: GNAT family protein [Kribbella]TCN44675.1 RimJ/RimL family protein N-acetyltransferase [Kribbella sp. VKM Ac-2500]TCO31547.1 RimJ/RimL family protein N-acetyltransferase [Kribbella orskensis]
MNTPSTPVFLRPLALSDVAIYASWGLDRRFCEHAGWTVDKPLPAHEAHWRGLITHPKPDLIRLAAVAGTCVVGYVDLAGDEPGRRELGYAIGPSDRWGQGLGGTVARLGLEHGFDHVGLDEIRAEALDANQASIRILTSLGMTETGKGSEEPFLGTASFYRQFSITKTDWGRRTAA